MNDAVYPGSFDPLSIAHLAIAEAARAQLGVECVTMVLSTVALGKDPAHTSSIDERVAAIERVAEERPWLRARVTRRQLLADIAEGAAWLILGADKWHQIRETRFYVDTDDRDRALARLPPVAVVPRDGWSTPEPTAGLVVLAVAATLGPVSATAIREHGRDDWRA